MLSITHSFINIFYLLVAGLVHGICKSAHGMVPAAIGLEGMDRCVISMCKYNAHVPCTMYHVKGEDASVEVFLC